MDTPKNAAGVPMLLPAIVPPDGGPVVIDFSGVPAGIDGREYSSADITTMDAAARQTLLEQLTAKYDGVMVDEGAGVTVGSLEFKLAPADLATYQELVQLGTTLPEHTPPTASEPPTEPASGPAPLASPAPTPPTGSSEPGFVHTEPEAPDDPRVHAQQHIDRLHALLDVVKQDLTTAKHWAVDEIRTILHALGATRSE